MSRSPQTHYTRSPLPNPGSGTFVEDAHPTRFPHHQTKAPERRQWPPGNRKFWVYESPSPSSSQDGKSSSSSGGKPTRSETSEERRIRTVSPYGSFFVEEMEPDTPENRSHRQGGRQERDIAIGSCGVLLPTRKTPSRWTSSQGQMAPVCSTTGYRTFTSAVPAASDHYDATATRNMTEMPFSALSLAENSRRSQPPLSWRHGYPDHPNHPQWGSSSQWDPPQVAAVVPRDKRQTDARDGSR